MSLPMAVIDFHEAFRVDLLVLRRAAASGFSLVQYETETGQLVWEWRRGSEPRPQFVTRRVALHWMREWLGDDDTPRIA